MVSVVKSGTSITFPVEAGVSGYPVAADTVDAVVVVDGVEVWSQSLPFSEVLTTGIVVPGSATTIEAIRSFADFTFTFKDAIGAVVTTVHEEMVISSDSLLRVAVNSFAPIRDLLLEAMNRADLPVFTNASREEQIASLISAYHNIGRLSVNLSGPTRYREPLLPLERIAEIKTTLDLTEDDIASLNNRVQSQLMQAQLIEAESLLGGNPIERHRMMGLLSHSAGESTHFYRTTKPLDLPVSRKTAQALWGLISYAVRISR